MRPSKHAGAVSEAGLGPRDTRGTVRLTLNELIENSSPNVAWQPNLPAPQKERERLGFKVVLLYTTHHPLSEERRPSYQHIITKDTCTPRQRRSHRLPATQSQKPQRDTNWLLFTFQASVATIIIIQTEPARTSSYIQWERI